MGLTSAQIVMLATTLAGTASAPAEIGSEPAEVYVRSYDGAYVAAAVRKPDGPGPMPAVLFIHGGVGGASMNFMKTLLRSRVPDHFFRRGYVVMSTDYRRYHFGEDEIQDTLSAYRVLSSYPFVDKSRVSVIGGSHGGYLAKMMATRTPIPAVVSLAGLSDIEEMFFDYAQEFRKTFDGHEDWFRKLRARRQEPRTAPPGAAQYWGRIKPGSQVALPEAATPAYEVEMDLAWRAGDRRELYRLISPMDNQAKISAPVLFVVGSTDNLKFAGKRLIDALKARGAAAGYSEHAGMDHGFAWGQQEKPPQQFFDALKVITEFIEKHAAKPAK